MKQEYLQEIYKYVSENIKAENTVKFIVDNAKIK